MIAVDTNLLVYAHRVDMPFHTKAAACIAGLANGRGSWAIPWSCVHEFFGVVTNPRAFNKPSSAAVAIATVEAWLNAPNLHLLHEAADHWVLLRKLVTAGGIQGARVHDARIAAICLGAGVRELWSADRDFARFPQLTVRNPLIG